jgi:Tfp pilus assembly protein PilZ
MAGHVKKLDESELTSRLKGLIQKVVIGIDTAPMGQKEEFLSILKDWQNDHRRKHSRRPCSVDVEYAKDGRAFKGAIKNVSVNGLFIETNERFHSGETITVVISLPNHSEPFRTTAEVIWHCGRGVGVRFIMPSNYLEELWKARIENL